MFVDARRGGPEGTAPAAVLRAYRLPRDNIDLGATQHPMNVDRGVNRRNVTRQEVEDDLAVTRTSGFSPTARASSRVRRETIDLGAQTLMKYTSGREKGLKNRAPYVPVWFTARSARCCDQHAPLRGRAQERGGAGC